MKLRTPRVADSQAREGEMGIECSGAEKYVFRRSWGPGANWWERNVCGCVTWEGDSVYGEAKGRGDKICSRAAATDTMKIFRVTPLTCGSCECVVTDHGCMDNRFHSSQKCFLSNCVSPTI